MSTKTVLTPTQAAILGQAQAALGKAARELLPPEVAADFEAEMAASRAEKFDEPDDDDDAVVFNARSTDGITSDQINAKKVSQAVVMLLEASHAPARILEGYQSGEVAIEVHLEEVSREEAETTLAVVRLDEALDRILAKA